MPNLGLGRLPATDNRNKMHPMRTLLGQAPAAVPTPDYKAWRFDGDPLDQGNSGTCVAHAAAHFIRAAPHRHKGDINPFDLYREIVLLDEYTSNDGEATEMDPEKLQGGSSGTGGAKALEKRGLISEYLWAGRIEDALLWVLTRGPVMLGTNWYNSMFNPTEGGYANISATARVEGGHEWLLRGWDKKGARGLAVNSWGPGWNERPMARWAGRALRPGHFIISQETLERLFHEDGDAVSAIEKSVS